MSETSGSPPDAATIAEVRAFWQAAACGERYARGDSLRERLAAQARTRYALEPCLPGFARFDEGRGRDVLEIGVGMGADHLEWARAAPRTLTGVDLTPHAIELTRARLGLHGLRSRLLVSDARRLPFRDASFDLVYSWGVIHHSPDTAAAAREITRVLRPGGLARVMVYQRRSLVGAMLWLRYALAAFRPWRSLDDVYARHLESPGTRAYSPREAAALFPGLGELRTGVELSPGDLLEGGVGARHRGPLLALARRLYPRRTVKRFLRRFGLYLTIEGRRGPAAGSAAS